ncbi:MULTISPECIES: hypothetical protein [unclassified Streptomyces]|uniref:hypothetical protein n=1 Tax=unclassified Streptomyces TaxID=2593676 RepID=UPI002250F612|nr:MULTISPECIES: hypothetical protein [unclassified Streptomyces]MCX5052195.1 hypothetical protein [Streptomyces sp. NBC_00474]
MTMWGSRFHRGYAMDAREEAARGLTDIEGYLYQKAHLGAAHRRVADFTARVKDLTPRQKRDIEGWYLDEQKHVARMVTDHIAERVDVLESQHQVRIRQWLRGTLTAMALITLAMIACVAVILKSSA